MANYAEGTVNFDQIVVMSKEFIAGPDRLDVSYYDYVLEVRPIMSQQRRKKGDPEHYNYIWSGHLNIGKNNSRIHLHPKEGDVGLVEFEQKITILRDKIQLFLDEQNARFKTPAKKQLTDRTWLNEGDTHYTGYVAIHLDKNGCGTLSFADCHRSLVYWVGTYMVDDDTVVDKKDPATKLAQKHLKELVTGLGKVIKAIQTIRSFFERELDSSDNKNK